MNGRPRELARNQIYGEPQSISVPANASLSEALFERDLVTASNMPPTLGRDNVLIGPYFLSFQDDTRTAF